LWERIKSKIPLAVTKELPEAGERESMFVGQIARRATRQLIYAEKRFDMNHAIDLDLETWRGKDSKRLKLLDTLVDKIVQRMDDNSWDDQLLLW
jgi:macrodomain Ter protein organizer (MatP/YcbG family)